MNDIKVVIDAGHGGSDPGAVANDTNEKDLNLMISKYMYDRFKELGIPVTLTRNTDETLTPDERVSKILSAYGDNKNVIVISNHINSAGGNSEAEGAEVIYALRNEDTLAKNILNELKNAGQKIRTVYQRRLPNDNSKDYYFIHRNTGNTEPVIVEYGYITNKEDLNRIKQNYKKYVDAVVKAVLETKNINISKPEENTKYNFSYVVKSGDSLWEIAMMFDTTVNEIKRLNSLNSDMIMPGETLILPYNNYFPYQVKSGDSLWIIAQKYNVDLDMLKMFNNLETDYLSVGRIIKIPSNTKNPRYIQTYVVKKKDTLWKIARMFNTTVDTIKRLNNLSSNLIRINQVLKLPTSEAYHTVKRGDTLWSIAKMHDMSVEELKRINNLKSDIISIGEKLIII